MTQYLSVPTQYNVTFPLSGVTLDVSGVTGLMGSFVDQIQQLENQCFAVNTGQQLWDGNATPAVGAQLDGIGQIVGIKRNGLNDATYILFIFAEIAANFSRATYLDVFNAASFLFNTTQIFIQDLQPATVSIEIAGSQLDPTLNAAAAALLENVTAGGVGIAFVAVTPQPNAFRLSSAAFATPNVNPVLNGLSSVVSPVTYPGGDLVSVIQ